MPNLIFIQLAVVGPSDVRVCRNITLLLVFPHNTLISIRSERPIAIAQVDKAVDRVICCWNISVIIEIVFDRNTSGMPLRI